MDTADIIIDRPLSVPDSCCRVAYYYKSVPHKKRHPTRRRNVCDRRAQGKRGKDKNQDKIPPPLPIVLETPAITIQYLICDYPHRPLVLHISIARTRQRRRTCSQSSFLTIRSRKRTHRHTHHQPNLHRSPFLHELITQRTSKKQALL